MRKDENYESRTYCKTDSSSTTIHYRSQLYFQENSQPNIETSGPQSDFSFYKQRETLFSESLSSCSPKIILFNIPCVSTMKQIIHAFNGTLFFYFINLFGHNLIVNRCLDIANNSHRNRKIRKRH